LTEQAEALSEPGILRRIARPAELALGLVFVASALLKAADINVFIVQLSHYGVLTLMLQSYLALLVIAVEVGLGVLLLLGTWRRLALLTTGFLLVAFTGAIVYGWAARGLDDCGCMGIVKMPPAVSILKNIVLLGLCAVAWRGLVATRLGTAGTRLRRALTAIAAVVLAFAIALSVAAYAHAHVDSVQEEIMGPRPFAAYAFEANGRNWNLGEGEYLVAILSTACKHCRDAVPILNELNRSEGLPPVVGLSKGAPELLERFRAGSNPEFPIHLIGFREFWQLVGYAPPRYVLVRDGKPLAVWDRHVPSMQQIEEARGR